eukprot:SAG11_NODE_384_length_9897_cov_11.158502_11_plen_369_part_00
MPEIEEISEGKSTPNKSTAPAEGPNITTNGDPQHDHESTEGQEKVFFSPAVKLRAAASRQVPGTTNSDSSPHVRSKEQTQQDQDDGLGANRPSPAKTVDPVGTKLAASHHPISQDGRNSGAGLLRPTLSSSDDDGSDSDVDSRNPRPRKKAKLADWRALFQNGDPATNQPAPGAGWTDLITMFSSMEDAQVALEEENEKLHDQTRAARAKYVNARDIIVRMSAASPSRDASNENKGYRKGFKTSATFNDKEDERVELFFETLDSDFNTFSVDGSTPGGARQMKEEVIKAMGAEVRAEYGRAKDLLLAEDPTAVHDYESIKEYMLSRFHRPQSDEELLASWDKLRQLKSESVRAFMLRVDRMLAQMRLA